MTGSILVPLDGSRFAEQALPAAIVRAEGVVLRGAVPSALRMAATSCLADLVVLASHRPPPFERVLYDSVADVLVRRSGVPVLLADGGAAGPWHVARVLIPLDGSAESEAAVGPAFDVAGPVEYGAPARR